MVKRYVARARNKIPGTMVSQHPDHASVPYWKTSAFISTYDETLEAFLNFSELGVSEYKWDWEGKLVDESVMERLLSNYYEYFKKNPLGVEKYLTFRLPNPRMETEFRLGRAFMNLITAAHMAKTFKLPDTPLFEVILPMTINAIEMMEIHEAFFEIANLKHSLYRMDQIPLKNLKVIPLFEDIETISYSDKILKKYITLYKKRFKRPPQYIRPYVARSDPSLNSGLIPTVLAIKLALSKYSKLEKETGIPMYPIIGSASLPFRGGLTPYSVKDFAREYSGIRTALIQSAFRYDYPKDKVIKAIKELEKLLPKGKAVIIPKEDEKTLRELMALFEKPYKQIVEKIAPIINKVASEFPKRRERVQHTGLFGYSRGVGKVKLPRAIGFTGALYSLGIPPELIGTGRGLKSLSQLRHSEERSDVESILKTDSGRVKLARMTTLNKYYLNLKKDLLRSGAFLNKRNLDLLGWTDIKEDIEGIEKYLGVSLEPKTEDEIAHQKITTKILAKLQKGEKITDLIEKSALLRKSLG